MKTYIANELKGKYQGQIYRIKAETPEDAMRELGVDDYIKSYETFDKTYFKLFELYEEGKPYKVDYIIHIAEGIKGARVKAAMTQVEAANLLGVPKRTLQDWESGKRRPKKGANYYEELIIALGRMTEEGRAAYKDGTLSYEELMRISKYEGARRASKWGSYRDTFRAIWDKLPEPCITKLSEKELGKLIDVIKGAK